jgi:hypothetical protein
MRGTRGGDDWTPDEETEPGIVRSARVQYHADPDEGMIVWDDDPDDMRYVLVTGGPDEYELVGWITVGDAKKRGFAIREG